jgi:hypothetical protein
MEKNPLSVTQAFAITNIEYFISLFSDNPDHFFKEIIDLINTHNIAENEEMMKYIHELLMVKGYPEYSAKFAEYFNMQIEKTMPNEG